MTLYDQTGPKAPTVYLVAQKQIFVDQGFSNFKGPFKEQKHLKGPLHIGNTNITTQVWIHLFY